MSYSIDVNVLVYAAHLADTRYERARQFLEDRRVDPDVFCVTWPTLMGFVRITTNPHVYPRPLPPDEALESVASLIALPRVRVVSEEPGFLEAYREVTRGMLVRGKLVPDAYLATVLRQNGVRTLYTSDRDFLKFRFLDVRDPFEESVR